MSVWVGIVAFLMISLCVFYLVKPQKIYKERENHRDDYFELLMAFNAVVVIFILALPFWVVEWIIKKLKGN